MTTKHKNTKRKSAGISLTPFLIIAGLLGFALTIYIGYRASISDRKLFSVSLIALFAGLLFESIIVSGSWKAVVGIYLGPSVISGTPASPKAVGKTASSIWIPDAIPAMFSIGSQPPDPLHPGLKPDSDRKVRFCVYDHYVYLEISGKYL